MSLKLADLMIVNAQELLTVAGATENPKIKDSMRELGIIKDGAIAIKGDRIVAVGTTEDLWKEYRTVNRKLRVLDASGKVVMPGFVDPHTHLIFAGSREHELILKQNGLSYMEILERGGGILSTVRATRAASRNKLIALAKQRLNIMLMHGTTTAEVKTGYGLNVKDELESLTAINILDHQHQIDLIPTLLAAHAIPPEYQANPDAYINLIIDEILPQIVPRSRGRSTQFACEFVDVFCEQHVFTVAQARRLLESARARGLSLKIHADEFVNSGAGKLAAELHAVSADHLQHTPLRAVRAMARAKVIGILLPATTLALMSHNYVDARKMIRTGLPIALGTDFNPNCWALSMQFIITLACYYMQMYPEEAIVAATINAAHAINRAHEVGSLEVGKKADIIILDVPNYMHIPYQFDVNIVDHVIKNGRIIK